jgi:hypothetical protein
MTTRRDPRWVILLETGEYSIVGRNREPDQDDIARFEAALDRESRAGWLAVMDRSEYAPGTPEIMMVRPLRTPTTPFEQAVTAFRVRCAIKGS